jgi:cell division protein FtsW
MALELAPKSVAWRLPPAGFFIVIAVLALTLLGLVALFSATQSMQADASVLLKRQLIWLGLALIAGVFATFINLGKTRIFAWLLGFVALFFLVLVLFPGIGVMVNGAQRWLAIGPMRFQVSELAKLAMVVVLAHYLARNQRAMGHPIKGFVVPGLIIGVPFVLIIRQPDFGTAFLCGLVGGVMLFLAGGKLRYILPTAGFGLVVFGFMVYQDPVRLRRITAFIDMEGTRGDASYQLWQGILAFGAGGITGVGVGSGRQQMAFLPEAHTDFIFAIVGEELGFIFTGGVVLLFFLIFLIGIIQLRRAPDLYQYLLVFGVLIMLTFQAIINIGVVTGCLPTKGISLPFISYGGSNLLFVFIFAGILLNGVRSWELPVRLHRAREL